MDATSVESIASISNSNTNVMSCGSSSSSSSASSGYASATTTPTNPASVGSSNHSQYSDSHSSTPVGMVEPNPTNAPTIAAITPYYNETFPQQQQQQQQRQSSHPQHAQPHAAHQQYQAPTHSYQLNEQLQSPTLTQYNNNTSTSDYETSYPYLGSNGESYATQQPTEVERNLLGMRHTTAFYTTTHDKSNRLPHTQNETQPLPLSHTADTYSPNNNNKIYNSNNNSDGSLSLSNQKRDSSAPAPKPQAAATPFYAQPTSATAPTYLEPYKSNATKLPSPKLSSHNIDYTTYGGNPAVLDASPYAQKFTPYHGSKMLQDIAYGTGQAKQLTPLTNARMPQQQRLTGGMHYATGSNNSSGTGNSSGAYMDKYVYTAVSAAPSTSYYTSTQPAANLTGVPYNTVTYAAAAAPAAPSTIPPQYAAEISSDTYRKPTAAASTWHWSAEYPNGNGRSLPPPPSAGATHNGLPTAAIPPTNAASFAPTSSYTASGSRDIYYNNKYDKYNTYYNPHQQYTSGRNVWPPNTPHGSAHLVHAQLTERLPPHPHHAYAHHAAPLHPGSAGAVSAHPSLAAAYQHTYTGAPPPPHSAGARQNCCSQTFQPQNCYYPRTAHYPPPGPYFSNTYNPHTAQPVQYALTGSAAAVGRSSTNNSAGKYSMLDYGHTNKTKINTNDLYAGGGAASTPPAYDAAGVNYHSYPTSVQPTQLAPHNQQQYSTATEHTLNASADISTGYYTDLNMQPTYENYLTPMQAPAVIQQRRESLVQRVEHLPNISIPYTKQHQSSGDYQKHTSAPINDDCFMGSAGATLTNLDEHMATNMNSSYDSSGFGEMQLSNAEAGAENAGTPTTPTTKTYSSLRDFLSTWNEDEDDYAAELQFVEKETQHLVVEQQVLRSDAASSSHDELREVYQAEQPHAMETQATPIMYGQEVAETYQTQPQPDAKKYVENSLNMSSNNLPDIIIDIEKSNEKSVLYHNFDVEKELDELETKKLKLTKTNNDITPMRTTGSVIKKVEDEAKLKNEAKEEEIVASSIIKTDCLNTFDAFEYVDTTKTHPIHSVTVKDVEERERQALTTTVQAKPDSTCDRGIESENTTSSNSSTFEKAYETFINKIGSELDVKENDIETPDISPDISQIVASQTEMDTTKDQSALFTKQNSDSDLEIAQKIKSYSKFYKRKRTYSGAKKDNECKKCIVEQKTEMNINSNFPLNYTKHCRKRVCSGSTIQKIRLKALRARLSKPYTYCYRRMRTLRRYDNLKWRRIYTKVLLKEYISTKLLENNLTLNESEKGLQLERSTDETSTNKCYNPKSLKCLSVSFINSEMFQNKLLKCKKSQSVIIEKNSAEKTVEHEKVLEEKEDITMRSMNEVIEDSTKVKRSLQLSEMEEELDGNAVDIIQNNITPVCKKLKLDIVPVVNSPAVADDGGYKNDITADNKMDTKENATVTVINNFETTIQNQKESLDLSETKDETENAKSALPLEQQELEGCSTIEDAAVRSDEQTDKAELGIPENTPSSKEYEDNMEVEETKEGITKIESVGDEVQENQMSTEYNDTEETREEIDTSNIKITVKDANELTNKIQMSPMIEQLVQTTFDLAETHQNQNQEDEAFTCVPNVASNSIEETEHQVLTNPTLEQLTENNADSSVVIADYEITDLTSPTKYAPSPVNTNEEQMTENNADSSVVAADYEMTDLTSPTKYAPSPINTKEESVGGFSEHELETISFHLRNYSNQSNSESKLVGFSSLPKDGELTSSNVENDINSEQYKDQQEEDTARADDADAKIVERKSNVIELDLSETENSVDMFGARKCAEYFTAASKKYFESSTNFDENSTDSSTSSSSNESTSSSSTSHKSASTSSNSSTDEDTRSSTSTEFSDFNEMKELEKELSQHQIKEMNSLWMETEEEQKTEAATALKVQDNSENDNANEKPKKESDVKTLKKILECQSYGQEEVKRDMSIDDDKEKQEEKFNADKDTSTLEHKEINTVTTKKRDNELRNEDNNEEASTSLTQRRDNVCCVDAEVLKANKVDSYDDDEIKNTVKRLSESEIVEEHDYSPKNSDDGAVLSLKNIALKFLERENSIENHSTQIMIARTEEDELKMSKTPKLSDLCKNALSSSFELSSNTTTNLINQNNNAPDKLERELSVEEALAEMYRQVGVTSDVDDDDYNDIDDADADAEVKEAQDVVLINLEEILVNDSDLYVLQCDMNENVLSVVAHNNLPTMIINENIDDNIEIGDRCIQAANDDEEAVQHEVEMRTEMGPFMGAVDEGIHSMEQAGMTHYSGRHTLEYVEDSYNSQFDDFPAIHHEEIVSQNSKRYKRQLLYNSLREKYVLKRTNFRIQHGNRVLKKYINRWILQCLIARFRERELRKVEQLYEKK